MQANLYLLMTVAFAALIHSGFSLGTSMMVLLSGHSLSRRRSHARLLGLTGGFVAGSFAMTFLILLALMYVALLVFAVGYPVVYLVLGTLTALGGVWVLFFYYRRGFGGTALWIPRGFARYLNERTAHTKEPAEAFVLGAASVVYELPVTIWLLLVAAASIGDLSPEVQVPTALGYALVAVATLGVVFILIGGGHTGAALTRFRARYKRFLQIIIGLSMIALGASLFLNNYMMVVSGQGIVLW